MQHDSNANAPRCGIVRRRGAALRLIAALTALGFAAACEYTHPTEVFVPDEDVIAVAAVIGAGFDSAALLATYPHRNALGDPPVVQAQLSGPGWTATFVQDAESTTAQGLWACNVISGTVAWKGPLSCLRAQLPEPIEEGVRYTLSGNTELGAFSGAATVPTAPVLVQPSEPFVATPAEDTFSVDVQYLTPAGTDFIVAEAANVVQVVVDSAGVASEEARFIKRLVPRELNPAAERARIRVHGYDAQSPSNIWRPPEFRIDLHLVGFDENFARFARLRYDRLVIRPWPSFGLTGDEGIFGYFGAASRSNPAHLIVRPQ